MALPSTKDAHMTKPETNKTAPAPAKPGKNGEKLIALLKQDGGATLADIATATGWLPHSARAMLTGLRKKGYALDKTKVDGVTLYRVTAEPAA
jgi:predicted ArsR family transcriptional regulator